MPTVGTLGAEVRLDAPQLQADAQRAARNFETVEERIERVTQTAARSSSGFQQLQQGYRLLTSGLVDLNREQGFFNARTNEGIGRFELLNRLGIQTTGQIRAQIAAIDDLTAAWQGDAVVTRRLATLKEGLNRELQEGGRNVQQFGRNVQGGNRTAQQFAYILNDSQQFAFGFSQGVRAISNNLTPLLATLRISSGTLGVLVIAAEAASTALFFLSQRSKETDEALGGIADRAYDLRSLKELEQQTISLVEVNQRLNAISRLREQGAFQEEDAREGLLKVESRLRTLRQEGIAQQQIAVALQRVENETLSVSDRTLQRILDKRRRLNRELREQARTVQNLNAQERTAPQRGQLTLAQRFEEAQNRVLELDRQITLLRGPGGAQLRGLLAQVEQLEKTRDRLLGIKTDEESLSRIIRRRIANRRRLNDRLRESIRLIEEEAARRQRGFPSRFQQETGQIDLPVASGLSRVRAPLGGRRLAAPAGGFDLRQTDPAAYAETAQAVSRMDRSLREASSASFVLRGTLGALEQQAFRFADGAAGAVADVVANLFTLEGRLAGAQLRVSKLALERQRDDLRASLEERKISYEEYAAEVELINLRIAETQRQLALVTGSVIERTFAAVKQTVRAAITELIRDLTRALARAGFLKLIGLVVGGPLGSASFGSLFLSGLGVQSRVVSAPDRIAQPLSGGTIAQQQNITVQLGGGLEVGYDALRFRLRESTNRAREAK